MILKITLISFNNIIFMENYQLKGSEKMKLTVKALYQILQHETEGQKTKENIEAAEKKLFDYIEKLISDINVFNEIYLLAADLCSECADNAFEDGFRIAAALFEDAFKPIEMLN